MFIVGMVREVIRPEWIEALAGSNTVLANAVAVGFGVFMYFPTLVEVPVARMFLDLGMHPGPLLAYLMADPELSLQSMLMVAAGIGRPGAARARGTTPRLGAARAPPLRPAQAGPVPGKRRDRRRPRHGRRRLSG